jgi:hypothetical protein
MNGFNDAQNPQILYPMSLQLRIEITFPFKYIFS